MSKPFSDRLSQFTPDGSALDRDALLFAAGRASARPNRGWVFGVCVLAACQAMTLALLLPKATSPLGRPSPFASGHDPVEIAPVSSPDACELGVLTRQFLAAKENDVPPSTYVVNLAPSDPPLINLAAFTLAEMK
jgi:hypothetical protein